MFGEAPNTAREARALPKCHAHAFSFSHCFQGFAQRKLFPGCSIGVRRSEGWLLAHFADIPFADEFFDFEQAEIDAVKDEAEAETEEGENDEGAGEDGAEFGVDAVFEGKFEDRQRADGEAGEHQENRHSAKKRERLVGFDDQEEFEQHENTVGAGFELGDAAIGPGAVGGLDFLDDEAAVEGLEGELGFDIEADGGDGNEFGGFAGEGAVAGKDVGDAGLENPVDDAADELVTQDVEVAEGAGLMGLEAAGDGHVRVTIEDGVEEEIDGGGVVGVVAIHQNEDVGIDFFEHGSDDVALALAFFPADGGAGGAGVLNGAVGAIVVKDINLGARESLTEVADDLGDGFFLLVTGNEDRDFWFAHRHFDGTGNGKLSGAV